MWFFFFVLHFFEMLKLSFGPFGPYSMCVVIVFTYTPSGNLIQNELQFAFGNHYIQSTVSCVVIWDTWPCSILYCPHNSINVFPFSMFSIILSYGGISWNNICKKILYQFHKDYIVSIGHCIHLNMFSQKLNSYQLACSHRQKWKTMNGQMCLLLINKSVSYKISLMLYKTSQMLSNAFKV